MQSKLIEKAVEWFKHRRHSHQKQTVRSYDDIDVHYKGRYLRENRTFIFHG